MDFSYVLKTSNPDFDSLENYGFTIEEKDYVYKADIPNSEFYLLVKLNSEKITAQVYESSTDELYALLDVKSANGAFVGELREKVKAVIKDIQEKCFITTDVHARFVDWVFEQFNVKQDFPWDDSPEAGVLRCPNEKWFGLIMHVPFKKLGIASDELVWIVNIKAEAEKVPELIDHKSIFPAWHMTKKTWISILLTDATDFSKLCQLTENSYNLVVGKLK